MTDHRLTGRGYDRTPGSCDADLVTVGRGTPGGELLRRYWHPVATSDEATDLPRPVRVLGEDLVLFRDGSGRPGLLYPRCAHRGASLLYARVEDTGLRCCYHGWKFDPEGRCLDQPCEPGGGRGRDRIRQPWYPLVERYGLVFAYLGPAGGEPLLPWYDVLEELEPDEELQASSKTLATGGPELMPCNWLQTYENVVDPFHVTILHSTISGPQFGEELATPPDEVVYETTPAGIVARITTTEPDGGLRHAVIELILPTVRIAPLAGVDAKGRSLNVAWTLPVDDTTTKLFTVMKLPSSSGWFDSTTLPIYGGRSWFELDEEGHQRFPGDYEAMVGQGPITLHSEEHLVSTDRGLVMLRSALRRAIADVADGRPAPYRASEPSEQVLAVRASRWKTPPSGRD
jgi:phenylpropionate dioxygenase-like ring-hydroxylating dioxygenase large terminal subunit